MLLVIELCIFMQKKNKGFTLIELLVVIAIIGILSSVVLASLNTARQKSRDAKRISDIKQLQLALELYFDTNRAYPTGVASGLLSEVVGLSTTYIPVLPIDPLNSGSNVYKYTGLVSGCSSYHLGATLENTSHTALTADSDAAANSAAATACGAGVDFEGADAGGVYDVKP